MADNTKKPESRRTLDEVPDGEARPNRPSDKNRQRIDRAPKGEPAETVDDMLGDDRFQSTDN
jgi:hypothetical protein